VCGGSGAGSFASDRTWASSTNGWGAAERDLSNGEQAAADGVVPSVGGVLYPKGIGVHAAGDVAIGVSGCSRFTAVVGIDAETANRGTVVFSVTADGVTLFTSPTVTSAAPVLVDVSVAGRTTLHLVTSDAGDGKDYDHGDWADARLIC